MARDDLNESSWPRGFPAPDITPSEFEQWVAEVFESAAPGLEGLEVRLHEAIRGTDGSYDFDATIRYRWAGMDFLVLAEAKLHKNPIKRDLVRPRPQPRPRRGSVAVRWRVDRLQPTARGIRVRRAV